MTYLPVGFTPISPSFISLPVIPSSSGEVSQTVGLQSWVSTVELSQPPADTSPVTTTSIQVIPLHDAVITIVTEQFRSYVVEESIDLVPTNPAPTGSSGPSIYGSHGLPSPGSAGLHKHAPGSAIQSLLGSILHQVTTLETWLTKILQLVHSDKSGPNSEINILLSLMPSSIRDSLNRYVSLLEEAGKHVTDTAKALQTDYAYGNTIVQSNAVHQQNVGRAQINTATVFSLNSPSTLLNSQQIVTQTRFQHTTADLSQSSFQHYFVRAEDQMTLMSGNTSFFTQGQIAMTGANLSITTGKQTFYADVLNLQVGQASMTPYHPTRSNSQSNYGVLSAIIQKDALFQTNLGKFVINSAQNTDIIAKSNGLNLSCLSGPVNIRSSVGNISLRSDSQITLNASGPIMQSGSTVNLSSSGPVVIRGTRTFINCGPRTSSTVSTSSPAPLNLTPQTVTPMSDVLPYPKVNPPSPGPASQVAPMTPEPPVSTAGSQNLGSYLTGG